MTCLVLWVYENKNQEKKTKKNKKQLLSMISDILYNESLMICLFG